MTSCLSKTEFSIYKKIFDDIDGKGKILPAPTNKTIITHILDNLLKHSLVINLNDLVFGSKQYKESSYYTQHKKFLDDNYVIKKEYVNILYKRFKFIRKKITNNISTIAEDSITKIEKDTYLLEEHHTIKHFNDALFKSAGDCKFRFIFNNKHKKIDVNVNNIQQIKMFVNGKIDESIIQARLNYTCNRCGNNKNVDRNIVASNPILQCGAFIEDKKCSGSLKLPTQMSDKVTLNLYDCIYETSNGEKKSILAQSMLDLKLVEHAVACIALEDNGMPYILILDNKELSSNEVTFNIPKKHSQNVLNVSKMIDDVIYKLTGDKIIGMIDVKIMLIFQKLYSYLFNDKIFNFAIKGDRDVGKNYVLERYGMLLYGGGFKLTNGRSVSIPSLRGTGTSNFNVTRISRSRLGLLNIKDMIFIDEINSNPELMKFLRPFLLQNSIVNDMADGDNIERQKTALVNIAENPSESHTGMYRGMIRKEYEKICDNPTLDDDLKISWDDNWDLYQHLWEYNTNVLLYKAIKNVRTIFLKKDVHWIDGVELPDKDRFMVDMFLKLSPNVESMTDRATSAIMTELSDDTNKLDLKMKLNVGNINEFFEQFKTYLNHKDNAEEVSIIINKIIRGYGFEIKSRLARTCGIIANLNRIINKRAMFNEHDYDMIKRFLMFRDRAIYPEDMEDFRIIAPKTLEVDDSVGDNNFDELNEDEFNDFE